MTIGKGTNWGYPGVLSPQSPIFASDADVSTYLDAHLQSLSIEATDVPDSPLDAAPIGLTGGALWRTVGGPGVVGRYATADARHYTCDLAIAIVDGKRRIFVASLMARNRWWTKVAVVMNAQDIGAYRFGHRAHPGDALLDVYEAHIELRDIPKIAKRAKLGSHLPHPGIIERRLPKVSFTFEQPRQLWLDEQRVEMVEQLSVTVVPDAFIVVV